MTNAVDGNLDRSWFANHDQLLETSPIMIVEQYLIHLHGVGLKMELSVFDLHRINSLRCSRSVKRHQEDAFSFIRLTMDGTHNMAFATVGLLTAIEQCHSCHYHKAQ